MYVFSHLHKAAGTTVNHVLRRTFGLRHLDVSPGIGYLYTEQDLRSDLSRCLKPQSIAGHGLRTHIGYGDLERTMEWYTIIRDPLDRCISHYQYQVQEMNREIRFHEWIKNDLHRNWMVYFFGGSDSLQRAIDSIESKNVRVLDISNGLNAGMQYVFSGKLNWKDEIKNPAKSSRIRDEIMAKENLIAELQEANELDMRLFQYMKQRETTPFPEPVAVPSGAAFINTLLSFLYRNLVYRTFNKKTGI